LVLSVWLISCVDVPSSGPTPPEFIAEFSFANAAEDLVDVAILVDGQSIGTVPFGMQTDHGRYDAGSRAVTLGNGDQFPVAMTTDQRGTVLLLPLTGTIREFIKLVERQIFQDATTSTAAIRAVHASPDAGEVVVTLAAIAGADTVTETLSNYRDVGSYHSVAAGDYIVTLTIGGTEIPAGIVTLSNMRQTGVVAGFVANSSITLFGLEDN
ncbi:MAG: hypothetical protein O7C75_05970, partial [Verrucomicrobia bacterium]|nr:hypothetical protein [Verrucomicrobiota bacterium]